MNKDKILPPSGAIRIGRHNDVRLTFPEDSIVPDGIYRAVAGIAWPDESHDGFAVLCLLECKENGKSWIMEQDLWQVVNPTNGLKSLSEIYSKWKTVYLRCVYYADSQGQGPRIFAPQIMRSIHFESAMDLMWVGWGCDNDAIQTLAQRDNEGLLTQKKMSQVHLAMTKYESDPKVVLSPLRAMMSAAYGLDAVQREWDEEMERWRRAGEEENSPIIKLSGLQGLV